MKTTRSCSLMWKICKRSLSPHAPRPKFDPFSNMAALRGKVVPSRLTTCFFQQTTTASISTLHAAWTRKEVCYFGYMILCSSCFVVFLFDRISWYVCSLFQSHRRNPKTFSASYISALRRVGHTDLCSVGSALCNLWRAVCISAVVWLFLTS